MKRVRAKEEFRNMTTEEVNAAIADRAHADNAITNEVIRLLEGYADNFFEQRERIGYSLKSFLHVVPDVAIERVAIRLLNETIQDDIITQKTPPPRRTKPRRST